jgi:hypothetical protein
MYYLFLFGYTRIEVINMAIYPWQEKMNDWELNLDRNRYDIMRKLGIKNDDKLDEIINVLKEFEVLKD